MAHKASKAFSLGLFIFSLTNNSSRVSRSHSKVNIRHEARRQPQTKTRRTNDQNTKDQPHQLTPAQLSKIQATVASQWQQRATSTPQPWGKRLSQAPHGRTLPLTWCSTTPQLPSIIRVRSDLGFGGRGTNVKPLWTRRTLYCIKIGEAASNTFGLPRANQTSSTSSAINPLSLAARTRSGWAQNNWYVAICLIIICIIVSLTFTDTN